MARTDAGAQMTQAHREAQLRIRAQMLADYLAVWPIWNGDGASFDLLVNAVVPLVRAYHTLSSSLASSYFESFRAAELAGGSAAPHIAVPLPDDLVRGTLHVVGREMTQQALDAGQSPGRAMRTAFVRTSGSVSRLALNGGRDTLVQSVEQDREALGWGRVTAATPCAFCALLAARGPVYKADTARFEAHDHCSCTAEPFYPGADWPGRGRELKALYDRAIREAKADGSLKRGTSNDALNAFRRALAGDAG